MQARTHALDFLSPIDARQSIISFGEKLIAAALRDETIAKKFVKIQEKMGEGKPIVRDPHFALFERVKTDCGIPNIPTLPDWLSPIITVVYLRAKLSMKNNFKGISHFNEKQYSKLLDTVFDMVDKIESDFLGELLVETVLTANKDKKFAKKLNKGALEFNELVARLYGEKFETPQRILKAASSGSNNATCSACGSSGTTTACTPIPCWVVIVIIVIVIVAK